MSSPSAQPENAKDLPVHPSDLPRGTVFKISSATGLFRDKLLTYLGDGKVVFGRAGGQPRGQVFDKIPDDAVVIEAEWPEPEQVEQTQREQRRANRMHEHGQGMPEWLVRWIQAADLHKTERATAGLPLHGPDKNPLDREHKSIAWKDAPLDSFFIISKEHSDAKVYAKVSDGHCFTVCTLEEWVSGKRPEIVLSNKLEIKTADLGIKDDTVVTVLNAPTSAQVMEQVDDYVARKKKAGETIDPRGQQHLQHIQGRADKYGNAA